MNGLTKIPAFWIGLAATIAGGLGARFYATEPDVIRTEVFVGLIVFLLPWVLLAIVAYIGFKQRSVRTSVTAGFLYWLTFALVSGGFERALGFPGG